MGMLGVLGVRGSMIWILGWRRILIIFPFLMGLWVKVRLRSNMEMTTRFPLWSKKKEKRKLHYLNLEERFASLPK
jgi:hypothetical protein